MFKLDSVVMADATWYPQKTIISGIHGIGKTTMASTYNKPFLIRTEDGAGNTHIPTFPKVVGKFSEIEEGIKALHGRHNYKTCIIDSLDWLEAIIWEHTIESDPPPDRGSSVASIDDYGFGAGYKKALLPWRDIMGGLDSLRLNMGMEIVLISHTEIRRHEPPECEPYDRYQIKLHKHAAALWQEWADIVLFLNYKISIQKTNTGFGKEKVRGTGTGERCIYTEERPSYMAKNHWGLPSDIYIGRDATWAGYHNALSESTNGRYNNNIDDINNINNEKNEEDV